MHDYDQTRPPRELDALVVYPFPSVTCPMLTAVTCLISLSSGGGGGGGSGRHVHSCIWLLSVYPEDGKLHKGRDPAVTPVPGQHCARAGHTVHLLEQQQSVEAIHDQDMLIQWNFTSRLRVTVEALDLIKGARGQFPKEVLIELSSQVRGNEGESWSFPGGANRPKGPALTLRTADTSAVFWARSDIIWFLLQKDQ